MEAMSERVSTPTRVSALRGGSTGLGGAVVQSAALIAPAAGATAGFVFIASEIGFATGVMLFGAYVLLLPFQMSFFSTFVSDYLGAHSVSISWQWLAAALI